MRRGKWLTVSGKRLVVNNSVYCLQLPAHHFVQFGIIRTIRQTEMVKKWEKI